MCVKCASAEILNREVLVGQVTKYQTNEALIDQVTGYQTKKVLVSLSGLDTRQRKFR